MQPTTTLASPSDLTFVLDLLRAAEDETLAIGDVVEVDGKELEPMVRAEVTATVVEVLEEDYLLRADDGTEWKISSEYFSGWVEDSPRIRALWERHQRRPNPDGVAYSDGCIPHALVKKLTTEIDGLREAEPADFHPGSGTRVRDLVHPSLYPFIAGRSTVTPPLPAPEADPTFDRFGRTFERSAYQWLPTPFGIQPDGSVHIASYINNLDRGKYPALYEALGELFSCALPLLESVLSYVNGTPFLQENSPLEGEHELPERAEPKPLAPLSLRGKELLVVPKIVDYELATDETHEGVWHVEGMSHEHIVATCVYVLDRDEELLGGDLTFKRAYTLDEAGRLFWEINQCRPHPIDEIVNEGFVPVGTLATPKGRLLVFPNSHIHKLSKLTLAEGATGTKRRRVVVFWVVDPEVRIPSTREVAPQQGSISHEEALAIRLALMEERKRHKQSLNVRAVSLCEH